MDIDTAVILIALNDGDEPIKFWDNELQNNDENNEFTNFATTTFSHVIKILTIWI